MNTDFHCLVHSYEEEVSELLSVVVVNKQQ